MVDGDRGVYAERNRREVWENAAMDKQVYPKHKKENNRETESRGIEWFDEPGAGTYDLVAEFKRPVHYKLVDAFDMFMENRRD